MKKFLVLLLALALLMSMSSFAFAGTSAFNDRVKDRFVKFKAEAGAKVDGDIYKDIYFENKPEAKSGHATAAANASETFIGATSKSEALGDNSIADTISSKLVSNTGLADAWSGVADAFNQANNSENETITETAEAYVDCSSFTEATGYVDSNLDGKCDLCGKVKDLCDCCPATVKGDIDIFVTFINKPEATTGDATAVGNASVTAVDSLTKTVANRGGIASNDDMIMVTNDGVATAWSGEATATNLANNDVCIDIFRGALTSKTIDIFKQILVR